MTETAESQGENKSIFLSSLENLIPNSGVCALHQSAQIALFYLPTTEARIYAVGNWDPIAKANVISRGVVGTLENKWVVASPVYKQHYCLQSGMCLDDDGYRLPIYDISIIDDGVYLNSRL